jgi:hypothetical protein
MNRTMSWFLALGVTAIVLSLIIPAPKPSADGYVIHTANRVLEDSVTFNRIFDSLGTRAARLASSAAVLQAAARRAQDRAAQDSARADSLAGVAEQQGVNALAWRDAYAARSSEVAHLRATRDTLQLTVDTLRPLVKTQRAEIEVLGVRNQTLTEALVSIRDSVVSSRPSWLQRVAQRVGPCASYSVTAGLAGQVVHGPSLGVCVKLR